MNSWALMIPFTFLLAGGLLWLVVHAVGRGDFDDWEGPAARHFLDDDACPEQEAERAHDDEDARAPSPGPGPPTR